MSDYEYNHNERGIITDPGKFESEPLYVPYFWGQSLECGADDDLGRVQGFIVTADDRAKFPGLLDDVVAVILEETDQGFVNSTIYDNLDCYRTDIAYAEDESGED